MKRDIVELKIELDKSETTDLVLWLVEKLNRRQIGMMEMSINETKVQKAKYVNDSDRRFAAKIKDVHTGYNELLNGSE